MLFRQLKYFVSVVKNNSFTIAAEECYISQTAISQQIHALDADLGTQLIIRENRSFSITPAGDYYTRNGLNYKKRELITFCFLSAQGGCEPQLISHASANIKLGNYKEFLIKVIQSVSAVYRLSTFIKRFTLCK